MLIAPEFFNGTMRKNPMYGKMLGTVALLVLVWSNTADAGIIISGMAYYNTLRCDSVLKAVPNPDTNPQAVECMASAATVELLCQNPQNQNIAPGQSAIQVVLVGSERIDQSDVTDKTKGKAEVSVIIEDDALLNPAYCVNDNWIPLQALVRSAAIRMNAYDCKGTDPDPCTTKVLTSYLEMNCLLPAEYDLVNNPPISGETQYQCSEPVIVNVR